MKYDYSKKVKDKLIEELLLTNPSLFLISLQEGLQINPKDEILNEFLYEGAMKYINKISKVNSEPVKKLKR